tara:strand:+ start:16 stop:867 length:852 start_codon:yes stop_codon:yes gene_type:complete
MKNKKNFVSFDLNLVKKTFPNLKQGSENYSNLEKKIKLSLKKVDLKVNNIFSFKEFGKIVFPYYSMGKDNSFNLFNANELVVFYIYLKGKKKYKNVADMGANLGLHSIILNKCGYNVTSFEPDPITFSKLKTNIKLNKIKNIKLVNKAVYTNNKTVKFTRVFDNMFSSHISCEKSSYGIKKEIIVKTVKTSELIEKFDFIKIDIEGSESKVIRSIGRKNFFSTDIIVEIGNKKNAKEIFDFLKKNKLKSYSQKNNFKLVSNLKMMPISHKEGTLFISQNINWF